jgi:Flp pilus assembly pilin Flp
MTKNINSGKWRVFLSADAGSVAIEYSLIAGAMFLAITPAFYLLRDKIWDKYNLIATYILTS